MIYHSILLHCYVDSTDSWTPTNKLKFIDSAVLSSLFLLGVYGWVRSLFTIFGLIVVVVWLHVGKTSSDCVLRNFTIFFKSKQAHKVFVTKLVLLGPNLCH
jgi:protein-S-isoprenylcysteine O-methyltransferase Ste14